MSAPFSETQCTCKNEHQSSTGRDLYIYLDLLIISTKAHKQNLK